VTAGRRATSDSAGPVVISRLPARGTDEPGAQSLPNDGTQSPMVAVAASAPAAVRADGSSAVYNLSAAAEKLPPLMSLPTTAQPPDGKVFNVSISISSFSVQAQGVGVCQGRM